MIFNILGAKVKVVEKDSALFNLQGQAHFDKNEIWVNNDLTDKRREETIVHEFTHWVLYRSGIREGMNGIVEEAICDALSFALTENKHLVVLKKKKKKREKEQT